jgi:hypothetical protein
MPARRWCFLVLSGALSSAGTLGCAGSGGTGDGGVDQAQACVDYLACLSDADAALYASLQGSYGPSGSCWVDDASAAGCADACASGLEDAAADYPDEPTCGAGATDDGGLTEGAWGFVATEESAICAARYGDFLSMTLSRFDATLVDAGDGTFTFDDGTILAEMNNLEPLAVDPLACTTSDDGTTFACEPWGSGREWMLSGGRYITDYWTLSGRWTNGGTTASATMTGELRSLSGEPNDECTSSTLLDGAPE